MDRARGLAYSRYLHKINITQVVNKHSKYITILTLVYCTIDECIKGAASLRIYDITFDANIDVMYIC